MNYFSSSVEVVLEKSIKGKSLFSIFRFYKATGEIVAIKMVDLESE